MKKQAKFGVGIGVILVALGFLAWLGYGESKTYYHTIAELQTLNSSQRSQRMRVGGTVAQGSCLTLLWTNRRLWWRATSVRMAGLWLSMYKPNARPNMKRLLGETPRAPQPVPRSQAACKGPGTTGGEAGSLWMYLVPLRSF